MGIFLERPTKIQGGGYSEKEEVDDHSLTRFSSFTHCLNAKVGEKATIICEV